MMQRLETEKAPEVGIRAWVHSGLARVGSHLAIAGSGSLELSLRRVCVELGVAESVHFSGSITDTDALLRNASIVLAPAPAEPFGLLSGKQWRMASR